MGLEFLKSEICPAAAQTISARRPGIGVAFWWNIHRVISQSDKLRGGFADQYTIDTIDQILRAEGFCDIVIDLSYVQS